MSIDLSVAVRGISGVHVTAYRSDGAIDPITTGAVVDRIASAGVHNIVSGGNTGEFYSLTLDEVRLLHDTAIAANSGRSALTAAVGRSIGDAIALGRRARDAGASAIMAHQPLDPFAAPQFQAAYFLDIAEGVDLPLVAYVRSDAMSLADILRVADHPNVVAVKFATTNVMLLSECIRASSSDTAIWVCGLAESWALPFYSVGARGFTSGLVNVDPHRSLAIHASLEAGDFARSRELVATIAAFEKLRTKFGNGANVTVVKAAMEAIGYSVGPVRVPGLARLDAADTQLVGDIVASWGVRHRGVDRTAA